MKMFAIKSITLLTLISASGIALADGEGGVDVAKNLGVLLDLAGYIAATIGFFLFANALYKIYDNSKGRSEKTIGVAILEMVIGTLLISAGWIYQILKVSFLAESKAGLDLTQGQMNLALDSSVLIASNAVGNLKGFTDVIPAHTVNGVLAFIFLVGFISFVNGIFSLKDVGNARSDHPVMKPIVKIIGGMLCMNILWFGCLLNSILGIPGICAE